MKKSNILIALASLVFTSYLVAQSNETDNLAPPTQKEKQAKFNYLLSHRLQFPLNSSRYPVFIFRDPVVTSSNLTGPWRSSGTALVKDGKPEWILSAAHCFADDGFYYVTVVTPDMNPSIWGVEKIISTDESNDVIMARVGVPTRIKGIPSPIQKLSINREAVIHGLIVKDQAQSQITGEKYALMGTVQYPGEQKLYLMDYSSTLAESGSGFLHGDEILVLSQFVVLSKETQKQLGVTPRGGFYTILTGVKVKWP